MAETFKAKLQIDTGSTDADLRRVSSELGSVNEASTGAAGGMQNLSGMVTAGILAYQQISGAISSAVGALQDMTAEMERQAGVFNRFGGDIDAARARTNGLVSDLDLMTVSNRAAAAGLQLTGEQLANIAVAAIETSSAVGGDATSAMNTLIGAVAEGRTGALRRVGVDLEGISLNADKQASALAQLSERWGDVESSADTLGGRLATLDTDWQNQILSLNEAVNANTSLTASWDRMTSALDPLLGLGTSGGLTGVEIVAVAITGTMNAVSRAVETAARNMRVLGLALDALSQGRIQTAIGLVGSMESVVQDLDATMRDAAIETARNRNSRTGRIGLGATSASGGGAAGRRSATRRSASPSGDGGFGSLIGGLAGSGDALGGDAQSAADEKARIAQNNATILQQEQAIARVQAEQAALSDRKVKSIQREADAQAEVARQMQEASDIGATTFGIINAGISAAIDGQQSFGSALKSSLKQWLKNFALKQVLEGGKNLAEGISLLITNPPASATKFIGAAEHFAVAAAAGGGSAAIPGGGGGAKAAARPTSGAVGGGGGGGGGGTVVINYNAPVAEADLGRQQDRASRAARNRFAA